MDFLLEKQFDPRSYGENYRGKRSREWKKMKEKYADAKTASAAYRNSIIVRDDQKVLSKEQVAKIEVGGHATCHATTRDSPTRQPAALCRCGHFNQCLSFQDPKKYPKVMSWLPHVKYVKIDAASRLRLLASGCVRAVRRPAQQHDPLSLHHDGAPVGTQSWRWCACLCVVYDTVPVLSPGWLLAPPLTV